MATTCLSLSLDSHYHHPGRRRRHHHYHRHPPYVHPYTTKFTNPSSPILRYKYTHSTLTVHSTLQDPLRTETFLSPQDLQNLQTLTSFSYLHKLSSGYVLIRPMQEQELDMIVGLLAGSFAESMLMPNAYLTFMGFLVKRYLIERRSLLPHTVTLIGYFTDHYNNDGVGEEGKELDVQLAGTVEVSFNIRGANASLPTPTPPRDCPYICNMTVTKSLRRRGIGWHLLKASEQLISKLSSSREVYLHCRMIDSAPLNMYMKAGYSIVKTDNILILLILQRRKHLMRKQLPPVSNSFSDTDASNFDEENSS